MLVDNELILVAQRVPFLSGKSSYVQDVYRTPPASACHLLWSNTNHVLLLFCLVCPTYPHSALSSGALLRVLGIIAWTPCPEPSSSRALRQAATRIAAPRRRSA